VNTATEIPTAISAGCGARDEGVAALRAPRRVALGSLMLAACVAACDGPIEPRPQGAELTALLAALQYEAEGELRPMLGVSLRLESLSARDAAGRGAWESEAVRSLRITDIRFPPGSQSYLIDETDGDAALAAARAALGATNSRTHAPQFSDSHLERADVDRISLGNEPPIHVAEFEPFGGYVNWARSLLALGHVEPTRLYVQAAQARTMLSPPVAARQQQTWDSVRVAWMSGLLPVRGVATTQKLWDADASVHHVLSEELALYARDFPGARIWLTEWNASRDTLAAVDESREAFATAEMLLTVARLHYETNGQVEALHYHVGWIRDAGSPATRPALATVVNGAWGLTAAGEAYRTFAPLLHGRWGRLPRESLPGVVLEAFTTETGERVLAYVNKRTSPVTVFGVVLPARSYGVLGG